VADHGRDTTSKFRSLKSKAQWHTLKSGVLKKRKMETWGRLTTIIISNSAVQPWRQWFIAFAQMIIIHFQVTLGYTAYDPSKSSFQMQSTVVIRPTLQVTRHGQLWREEFWPKSRVPQRNEDRDIPSKKNFPTSCQNREDFCSEEMIFWKCHLSHVDLKSSPSLHKGHSSHGMKSRSY